MEQKKIDLIWLIASIGSFALMSVSFLLMPLDKTVEQYDAMDVIPGVMFWLFLILGILTQVHLSLRRKRSERKKEVHGIGIFSFCKNIYATVADVVTIISLVGLIVTFIVTKGMGYICCVFVCIFLMTFCLHCIFNGQVFLYLIQGKKHNSAKVNVKNIKEKK